MVQLRCLNVGCGNKYHKDWVNIDQGSDNPDIVACDLFKGLPFDDDTFDVLYLSQVVEHFYKKDAFKLMQECRRVLKVGGIIRIAVPDMESIARNYLKFLEINLKDPTPESVANYEWMIIELYDQTTRNVSGGEMLELMVDESAVNKEFIIERLGLSGKIFKSYYFLEQRARSRSVLAKLWAMLLKALNPRKLINYLRNCALKALMYSLGMKKELKFLQIGKFRMSGEIHYQMYDRYSLSKLLEISGFREIKIKTPLSSDIPEWHKYELDVKNGEIYDPTALFMEAKK